MKYTLYPGSFKPFHRSHYDIINSCLNDSDIVIVIISLSDRDNISGRSMALIWKNHIIPMLPNNVRCIFTENSPIKKMYELLGNAEDLNSKSTFSIISDEHDIERYKEKIIQQYYPNLYKDQRIILRSFPRTNISGTKMREFLKNNDKQSFIENLPPNLDGDSIFSILSS